MHHLWLLPFPGSKYQRCWLVCAGWYAPLLFTYNKVQFSHVKAQIVLVYIVFLYLEIIYIIAKSANPAELQQTSVCVNTVSHVSIWGCRAKSVLMIRCKKWCFHIHIYTLYYKILIYTVFFLLLLKTMVYIFYMLTVQIMWNKWGSNQNLGLLLCSGPGLSNLCTPPLLKSVGIMKSPQCKICILESICVCPSVCPSISTSFLHHLGIFFYRFSSNCREELISENIGITCFFMH